MLTAGAARRAGEEQRDPCGELVGRPPREDHAGRPLHKHARPARFISVHVFELLWVGDFILVAGMTSVVLLFTCRIVASGPVQAACGGPARSPL